MTLEDLKRAATDIGTMTHTDRIKLFGWWLHAHKGKDHFQQADIAKCYGDLHISAPSTFGNYFASLVTQKHLLKTSSGWRLENKVRDSLDQKYGQDKIKVQVTQLLKGLPEKLPTLAEKTYLGEALICYENEAFRAAVVMTWNLAYAHLCDHIIRNRLADFNARWLQDHAGAHKNKPRTIVTIDDFNDEELKENQVLKICLNAGIVVKNVYNVFEPALKRRNAAAHPNNVVIDQLQTDAYISDLINNVILKIV